MGQSDQWNNTPLVIVLFFRLQFLLIVSIKIRRRIHMRKGFNEEEYGKPKFLNWLLYSLSVLETHKITDNMISARFSYFISSPSLRPCVISCSFVIHCIRPHVVLSVSLFLEKKVTPLFSHVVRLYPL